jgi:hypothetical protein
MRASDYQRVVNDFYVEPRWMVDALMNAEPLVGRSWDDPAARRRSFSGLIQIIPSPTRVAG